MFGLSFLNPLILIGLVAVAIPVAIHIISHRRSKTIMFSSLALLELSVKERIGLKKMQEILTLIFRTLLIFFLVLACAKPLVRHAGTAVLGGQMPTSAILILDNSYSMGYHDGETTRFEKAKRRAIEIVDTLKPKDRATLLLTNAPRSAAKSWPETTLAEVKKQIERASLSQGTARMLPTVLYALNLAKQVEDTIQEMYILSDFQEVSWQDLAIREKIAKVKTRATAYALDFGEGGERNILVSDAKVVTKHAIAGRPTEIEVTLSNSVAKPSNEVVLLAIDGEIRQKREVAIRPGETANVRFSHTFTKPGPHVGLARLQEGDPLPADNGRFFHVSVSRNVPVLCVDGAASRPGFLRETFYLTAAINPVGGAKGAIEPVVVSPDGLALEEIDSYPLVVLVNVGGLDANARRRLEHYVAQGGGLLIFLGEQVNPNDALYRESSLLPVSLLEAQGNPRDREAYRTLRVKDFAHPIFRLFRDPANGDLSLPHFYRYYALKNPEGSSARVLAEFDNGQPAFVEVNVGKGTVIVCATACDARWSDFPTRPTFLPLMQRIVEYLVPQTGAGREYLVAEEVSIEFPYAGVAVPVEVKSPDGQTHRIVSKVSESGSQARYDKTDATGKYEVKCHTPEGDSERLFVINVDARESNFAPAPAKQIEALLPGVPVRFISLKADVADALQRAREGVQLWGKFLLIVLALAIVECYFANRSTATAK